MWPITEKVCQPLGFTDLLVIYEIRSRDVGDISAMEGARFHFPYFKRCFWRLCREWLWGGWHGRDQVDALMGAGVRCWGLDLNEGSKHHVP